MPKIPMDGKAAKRLLGYVWKGHKGQLIAVLICILAVSYTHLFRRLIRQPQAFMAFARAFLFTGKGVIHDDADDDFALSVGVPRVVDGIHIRPVAQRLNGLKLPGNAAIHLFVAALTQHKLILFR